MPRKKKIIRVVHKKRESSLRNVLAVLSAILVFDGSLRILFSLLSYAGTTLLFSSYFQARWFLVGLTEIICSFGLYHLKKWALIVLFALSVFRLYTILMYLPQGLLPPIQNNVLFYLIKIASVVLLFYLFTKRKQFK